MTFPWNPETMISQNLQDEKAKKLEYAQAKAKAQQYSQLKLQDALQSSGSSWPTRPDLIVKVYMQMLQDPGILALPAKERAERAAREADAMIWAFSLPKGTL